MNDKNSVIQGQVQSASVEAGSRQASSVAVAQLVHSLIVGGAEQLAVQIANERARQGVPSYLYVLRHSGPLIDKVDPAVGLRFLGVRRRSIANPWRFVKSLLTGRRKLLQQLAADNCSIVQSHLPNPNFWNLLLSITGPIVGAPTIHNNKELSYGRGGIRGWLNRFAYRLMMSQCGAIIACSNEVRMSLIQMLDLDENMSKRLVAVPNGVTIPDPLPLQRRFQVRQAYGLEASVPLVVAAGRLTAQKNFKLLIEAAAILKRQLPDVRIIICGEGELRPDLEQQIDALGVGGMVSLPGNVNNLQDLLLSADLFVLPSLYEGLPLVLLEAMACGLPAVGSRIKGTTEVVEENRNGLLVESGDAPALAAALEHLLANDEMRTVFGIAAKNRIEQDFSFVRLMSQLEDLYSRLSTEE